MNYVKREIQETRFYSLLFMIMDSHKYIFGFKCEVYYEGGDPYSLSMMNYAKKEIFTGTGCLLIKTCFSALGFMCLIFVQHTYLLDLKFNFRIK